MPGKLAGLAVALCSPAAQLAGEPGQLEEVEVLGKKLRELRREIVEAEDRFYARDAEYRRRMVEVVKKHPELQKLLLERWERERRYEKAHQERFKGRWILRE